jgi:hypothetical protein
VLNLTCYYFETLLLSRDVNSPRLCFVNSEAECDAVPNLTLTYGKKRHFELMQYGGNARQF